MNRVLFASSRPAFPLFLGGAEWSVHELALALADSGWEARVLGHVAGLHAEIGRILSKIPSQDRSLELETLDFDSFSVPNRGRIEIRFVPRYSVGLTLLSDFEQFAAREMERFAPDVVVTQLDGALDLLRVAEQRNLATAHFVRDTFNPVNLAPFHRTRGFVRQPDLVLANSAYTARHVRETTGRSPEIVYPIVSRGTGQKRETRTGTAMKTCLLINPSPYKGGDLMPEVAKALTEVRFIVAPGWGRVAGRSWRELPNVTVLDEPVRDKARLFGMADFLVVPSQRPEGFGRVAVEAQAMGLPVLASNHTGLAEALGDSALLVTEFRDAHAWLESIRRLVGDPVLAGKLRRSGLTNADRFQPENIVPTFQKAIERVLNTAWREEVS